MKIQDGGHFSRWPTFQMIICYMKSKIRTIYLILIICVSNLTWPPKNLFLKLHPTRMTHWKMMILLQSACVIIS